MWQPDAWWSVWGAALGFGLVEACAQWAVIAASPPRHIGDESAAIARSEPGRMFTSRPFFRVPVLPLLAGLGGRLGRPVGLLRFTSVGASAVAVSVSAATAIHLGGLGVGVALGCVLLVIPERFILGSRIWPDVYLAAVGACLALLLCAPDEPTDWRRVAPAIGALLAIAALTRLDGVILVPSTVAAGLALGLSPTSGTIWWFIAAPLGVFAFWWLVSWLALGQRWPDDTWRLNLALARQEIEVPDTDRVVVVDDLIRRYRSTQPGPGDEARRPAVASVGRFVRSVASRLRAMLGPDTFVGGKVVPTMRGFDRRPWFPVVERGLRLAVPLLFAATVVCCVWWPERAIWCGVPAVSTLILPVLIHARTRLRLAAIYGVIPMLAASIGSVVVADRHLSIGSGIAIVGAVLALWLVLARPPRRLERIA